MAVQAQYPLNPFSIGSNLMEEFQQLQQRGTNVSGNPFHGYQNYGGGVQVLNGTVFSEPESELTCNASGSRKRTRDDVMVATLKAHQLHFQQQQLCTAEQPQFQQLLDNADAETAATSAYIYLYDASNRLHGSGGTSTSGRSAAAASPSFLPKDMDSHLCNQNLEFEALIRHQNQKLRVTIEETRKKQTRSILSVIEQHTLKRLQEKETELEKVSRVNGELQERLKQMSAENQIWFNVAKNSEATVSSLRQSLEQVLLQNAGHETNNEGYGETAGLADDAQSCCHPIVPDKTSVADEETMRRLKHRKFCKGCGGADISVLLLPCRHLCLCKYCEHKLDSCPICKSTKNATLQVFIS